MTTTERSQFLSSLESRQLYWEDIISESIKHQQVHIMRIAESLETFESSNGHHHLNGEILRSLTCIQYLNESEDNIISCGIGPMCGAVPKLDKTDITTHLSHKSVESNPVLSSFLPPQQEEPFLQSSSLGMNQELGAIVPNLSSNKIEIPAHAVEAVKPVGQSQAGLVSSEKRPTSRVTFMLHPPINESEDDKVPISSHIKGINTQETPPILSSNVTADFVDELRHVSLDQLINKLNIRLQDSEADVVSSAAAAIDHMISAFESNAVPDFEKIRSNDILDDIDGLSMQKLKSLVNSLMDSINMIQRNEFVQHESNKIALSSCKRVVGEIEIYATQNNHHLQELRDAVRVIFERLNRHVAEVNESVIERNVCC